MSRILEICYDGRESSFSITRISRSKLYGSKRRIPVDGQGNECSRASLTSDGIHVLPIGGIAMLYLDENGDVVERDQLRAIDIDGEMLRLGERILDGALEVGRIVQAADMLECIITHVYALEPVFLSQKLGSSLSKGNILSLTLPTQANHCHRRFFLLGNDSGYFLLIGEETGFELIGLAEADLSPPDMDEGDGEEGNNIDFGML